MLENVKLYQMHNKFHIRKSIYIAQLTANIFSSEARHHLLNTWSRSMGKEAQVRFLHQPVLATSSVILFFFFFVPTFLHFRWDGLHKFLSLPRKTLHYFHPYYLTNAFVRSYKNLNFYWILGAGHMVNVPMHILMVYLVQILKRLLLSVLCRCPWISLALQFT